MKQRGVFAQFLLILSLLDVLKRSLKNFGVYVLVEY
jgi:hypothetical protein